MQLTEEQQNTVRQWAAEGAPLGEIQKRMADELEVQMPYMEVRFLVADLEISIKDKEKPKEPEQPASLDAGAEGSDDPYADLGSDLPDDDEVGDGLPGEPLGGLGGGGNVSVTIDTVVRPGMMVSGKATFSDGETAAWHVDQMGQLGLDPTTPGYRPTEPDLMKFQQELQAAAQKAGL